MNPISADHGLEVVVASVLLPADTRSAARARAFVSDFCTEAALSDDVCHTAALLVSELVTNSIVHGRTTPVIEVRRTVGVLRVAVRDDEPSLPQIDVQRNLSAEDGRGLLIVSLLAARWGIEPAADGGKAVWFELDI